MSEEYKVIHANVFDPSNALFKSSRTKPAEVQTISCKNSENCQLFKKGECTWKHHFSGYTCPYGRYNVETGYTTRAKGFYTWISDKEKQYEGVGTLKASTKKLAIVGDYIYFPYAHANMNEAVPFIAKGGFMLSGSDFIPKENWTLENILKIVNFRPRSLFGEYISTYWTEEMPLFLAHLDEVMPEMYKALLDYAPGLIETYKLNKPKNYVGRTAKLKTISPCTFRTSGYEGKHKMTWTWDGTTLKTKDTAAYNATWGEVREFESMETIVTPTDNTTIKISDNAQVNSNTVFID